MFLMPSKSKSVSGESKQCKRKRPATSPLSNESTDITSKSSGHITQYSVYESGPKSGCPKQLKPCTQVNENTLQSYVDSVYTHYLSSPCYNMSFASQPSFAMQQPMGSPFGFHATPLTPPSSATPAWATELLDEMKQIKEKLKTIDKIEKTVNSINVKVMDLEAKMTNLDTRVSETEKSCQFSTGEIEDNKKSIKSTKEELKKIRKTCESMEAQTKSLVKQNEELGDKITDLESRSMRENLLFHGIPEQGDAEDCSQLVKDVIKEKLNFDHKRADDMIFDRAHRLGRRGGKTRPIVVKFHYYHDREAVRKTSFDNTQQLKQANMGIGPQVPKEIRDARRPLYPVMKSAKDAGKPVKFVGKKLFIEGREYHPAAATPTTPME